MKTQTGRNKARWMSAALVVGMVASGCVQNHSLGDWVQEGDGTDTDTDAQNSTPATTLSRCWTEVQGVRDAVGHRTAGVATYDDDSVVWAINELGSATILEWYDAEGGSLEYLESIGGIEALYPTSDGGLVVGVKNGDVFRIDRIDRQGNVDWTLALPSRVETSLSEISDVEYPMDVDAEDNVIIAGVFGGSIALVSELFEKTLAVDDTDGFGAFVAQLNSSGELMFAEIIDAMVVPTAVALTDDGRFYLIGNPAGEPLTGCHVAAFESSGVLIWETTVDQSNDALSTSYHRSATAFVDDDGGVMISGKFFTNLVFTDVIGQREELRAPLIQNSTGSIDMLGTYYVARYTRDGILSFAASGFDGDTENYLGTWRAPAGKLPSGELGIVCRVSGTVTVNVDGTPTTLSRDEWPMGIVTYTHDGALSGAAYLDTPEWSEMNAPVAKDDGTLVVGADYDLTEQALTPDSWGMPLPVRKDRLMTVQAFCP